MVYYFSEQILNWSKGTAWESRLSFLRLFHYLTVRSTGAAVTALLLSLWLGPKIIHWLKTLKFGQDYKDRAEEAGGLTARILSKKGTPTMGGFLIISVLVFSTMLWAQWNPLVELTLVCVLVLSGLGFYDDYAKIIQQSGGGTPPRVKLLVQTALGVFVGIYLWKFPMTSELRFHGKKHDLVMHNNLVTDLMLPFSKYPYEVWAVVGLLVVLLAIVGSSNAVNLTDGLDGLAIGCTLIVGSVFLIFTYLAGNAKWATYLQIPYVAGAGELTVFCAALIGAGLGFLWFNCHPAQVFMGDTGSLALGGAFGIIAVLIHQPFVLVIAGGIFVLEAGSVMLPDGLVQIYKKALRHGPADFFDVAAASSF
ncbi:MAG: phospho-N-acetylmuramoyl-pentapeptide-transferase [Limisphaerales bacterium]